MAQYMAMSTPPDDGTPPAVRTTVDSIDELATAFRTLSGVEEVRAIDGSHKEYGEGIQRRRIRGQDREFAELQMFLGGRPLNKREQDAFDRALAELDAAVKRFGFPLGGWT